MAFKKKADLGTDTVIQLGGTNSQTGKPNPKQVEGYYLGFKATDGDYGPGKLHIFQTETGNVGVWGKTKSNGLLTSDLVGQMVRLTFTGMGVAKKGRRPAYNYSVEHDDENTISVSTAEIQDFGATEADDTDTGSYDTNDVVDSEDEAPADEVPPARPVMTTRKPAPASPEARAKVQALLNRNKSA